MDTIRIPTLCQPQGNLSFPNLSAISPMTRNSLESAIGFVPLDKFSEDGYGLMATSGFSTLNRSFRRGRK